MGLEPGDIIEGKYRIIRLLGEGGMGAVYEAENTRIARRVAIKVLLGEAASRNDVVQRFEREAQAAGRIGSDHILEILDFGNLLSGDRYMVMEYLDGEELSSRIKRGALSPQECVPLFKQLLIGLEAAHAAGIVHRDLKPDNIFIVKAKAGTTDFVKIIDFGISKFNQLNDPDHEKTKTGMLMGTPYYLSPEQARGSSRSDPRSDIYSCGVILYQCVTGVVPFDAETLNELLFAIVLNPPRPIDEVAPHLDADFRAIIDRAMARELADRFQSAKEFREALEAWAQGLGFTAPAGGSASMPVIPAADMSGQHRPPQVSMPHLSSTPNLPVETSANWSQSQPMAPAKSKTGLFLGLGAAALALIGVVSVVGIFALKNNSAETSDADTQADAGAQLATNTDLGVPEAGVEVSPDQDAGSLAVVTGEPNIADAVLDAGAASSADAAAEKQPDTKTTKAATTKNTGVYRPPATKATATTKTPPANTGGGVDFGY